MKTINLLACLFFMLAVSVNLNAQKISEDVVYIVDGKTMEKGFDVSSLDTDNIQTIEVLKGKAAVEEYEGATEEGVIIITTKDGQQPVKEKKFKVVTEVVIEDDDENSFEFEFRKNFKNATVEKDHEVTIEEELNSLTISASGSVKSGKVELYIKNPEGKTIVSNVEFDESGALVIDKKLTFKEGEVSTGIWVFHLKTTDASGSFKISFDGH